MSVTLSSKLSEYLAARTPAALAIVDEARGSTPRNAGTKMLVTMDGVVGTIGGGRFEWDTIAEARKLIERGLVAAELDIPLGPEIGQCCGGRVIIRLERVTAKTLDRIVADEAEEEAARPTVLIFGAGHVGKALAIALSPLPFKARLIDSRMEEFAGFHVANVTNVKIDHMAAEIEKAPVGAAYLMMTHSHALDATLAGEVLGRGDFAYLGIIGSHSKRKRFLSAFRQLGISSRDLERITCPIGGAAIRDKRPAIIAAMTAVELLTVYAAQPSPTRKSCFTPPMSSAGHQASPLTNTPSGDLLHAGD